MLVCDPSHIWFRKYLEWLFDAIVKTSLLSQVDLRTTLRFVCSKLLNLCRKENLLTCSIDRCFEWINTFQWMYQFDKEISWIDDAEWAAEEGCWNSSVWPAGQDLGEGTLLFLIGTMEPLLRRCAVVLAEQSAANISGEDRNRGATELMRFSECAGECMRILSAILKPRRGGIISTVHDEEKDEWGVISDSVLECGCKILSSDLVSKVTAWMSISSILGCPYFCRPNRHQHSMVTSSSTMGASGGEISSSATYIVRIEPWRCTRVSRSITFRPLYWTTVNSPIGSLKIR